MLQDDILLLPSNAKVSQKNSCFTLWGVFTEKLMLSNCGAGEDLRVPWTARRPPVHPKGNQPRMFIGRIDAEDEAPILWPPDVKN